ncbi:hypothetical protein VULLAG_LOCUS12942 [Vulpes lagopus]
MLRAEFSTLRSPGDAEPCGRLLPEQGACELEGLLRAGWSQVLSGKAAALASEMRPALACITLQSLMYY